MFTKLGRIFLGSGFLVNALTLLLRENFTSDFWQGFCEGVAIALILGGAYFFNRARKAGEPDADSSLCRRKQEFLQKWNRGGTDTQ